MKLSKAKQGEKQNECNHGHSGSEPAVSQHCRHGEEKEQPIREEE